MFPYFSEETPNYCLNVEALSIDDTNVSYFCPCCVKGKRKKLPVIHLHGSQGMKENRIIYYLSHHQSNETNNFPNYSVVNIHITDMTARI